MPNACYNTLVASGTLHDLEKLQSHIINEMRHLIDNNYAAHEPTQHAADRLIWKFFTDWSPPLAQVKVLIEKFPCINFSLTYYEPLMQFEGIIEGRSGKVEKNESHNLL